MFNRRFKKINLNKFGKIDYSFIILIILLCLFGLVMIFEASSVNALRNFQDKFYFVKDQAKWLVIGFFVMLFFANFDYKKLYNLSLPLLVGEILLLLLVFVPGIGVSSLGASRWLNFGFVSFQPSELAKIILIIYLASWFTNREKGRLLAFLVLLSIYGGLIILQPDMGTTTILIFSSILIYFVSGAPLWHFIALLFLGIFSGAGLIKIASYRMQRFLSFLHPEKDPLGISYHINQILISIGSGGFWGAGIGRSKQKYAYLPESSTDSIFAIIAEEIGFLGSVLLIFGFFLIFAKGYKIALKQNNRFGKLLAMGLTGYLFFQTMINLGGMVALFPLTGVPLPFISYGGSSLVSCFMALGILLNIDRQ